MSPGKKCLKWHHRRTGEQTRRLGIGRRAADAIKLEVVVRGLHGLGQVVGAQTLVRGARNPQRAVGGDDVQTRTLCSAETGGVNNGIHGRSKTNDSQKKYQSWI